MFFSYPKLIIGAVALFALIFAITWIWQDGADSARRAVERQNNEAAQDAGDARSNYDRCIDDGGLWSFDTGKCRRP